MSIFTESISITENIFLQQYWQKKALFLPSSINALRGIVSADDLMDIACEEESEARIITGFGMDGPWRCKQGPFVEDDFRAMGERNWTLLVQSVDQWIEEVNAIMDQFLFLPKWRLEDIMASLAPIGGGVGPHFDYYDVFLLQISGSREWQLGQMCSDASTLQENAQVKLLDQFVTEQRFEAHAGDMLYIPAGVAHWGSATTNDCITLSVGFRAPSQKEILLAAFENLIEDTARLDNESQRYQDKVCSTGEGSIDKNAYRINAVVETQLNDLVKKITPQKIQQAINTSFGQLVTEPRYLPPLEETETADVESLSVEAINQLISAKGLELQQPVYSRFAFSSQLLFVNGASFSVSEQFAKEVCDSLLVTPISEAEKAVLLSLLESGDIALDIAG